MPFFTRMDVLLLSYTNPESIIKLPVPNGRAFFVTDSIWFGFHTFRKMPQTQPVRFVRFFKAAKSTHFIFYRFENLCYTE